MRADDAGRASSHEAFDRCCPIGGCRRSLRGIAGTRPDGGSHRRADRSECGKGSPARTLPSEIVQCDGECRQSAIPHRGAARRDGRNELLRYGGRLRIWLWNIRGIDEDGRAVIAASRAQGGTRYEYRRRRFFLPPPDRGRYEATSATCGEHSRGSDATIFVRGGSAKPVSSRNSRSAPGEMRNGQTC